MKSFLIISSIIVFVYMDISKESYKNDFLNRDLNEIEEMIRFRESINPKVSEVPVKWHLYHMLKTVNEIYNALERSDPKNYKASFSISRVFSHTFNYIPRGRAESPDVVMPPDIITYKGLIAQLEEARKKTQMIDELDENAFFEHPVFKRLNKRQAKRFLEVHTQHHLKIVHDILKEN